MSRRPRGEKRTAEPAPAQWYQKTSVKFGVGVVGIVIFVVILFFLRSAGSNSSPATTGGSSGSGQEQVIAMSINGIDYVPSVITVRAGTPVRWEIDASQTSGCMLYLKSQGLGIAQSLTRGKNVITFTPTKPGSYPFTCSMGMGQGTIQVV